MTRGSARGGLAFARDPRRAVRSVVRGAAVSKLVFTGFIAAGSLYAFSQFAATRSPASLVSAVTFGLALSLAYLVLYSLQVLPAFAGSEPYTMLASLPISDGDLSLVTMLSIVRTFDAIALATVAAQVGAVAYFTGSIPAAAVVGVASVGNCVFGVALALALSGAFQRNIRRGGRGKGAALGRTVFLISWGFAAASLGFLFNLVGYIVPVLDSAVSGSLSSSALPMAFSLVHPFYAGFLAASLAFPEFPRGSASLGVAAVLSFGALAAYSALALAAGRWALRLASKVARGAQTVTVRQRATDLLLKVRRPVPAYVLKDVRVASKTPATAFIFALPVLEAVVIVLELTSVGSIRAYSVLTATALGCLFTLISASVLLNTEGTGLDYTLSLPLGARVIVLAKSAVATAAYLPVPAAVGLLLLFGRPSSAWLALVPLAEVPSVLAATRAELSFFISGYRRSGRHTSRTVETRGLSLLSARDLFRLGAAMVVAGILALAPLLAYAVAFVVWRDHAPSLGALAVVSAAELGVVEALLRRP